MKVILLQDIKDLGRKDEVKEVAEGFARNFLFPRELAEAATEGTMKALEERRGQRAASAEADLQATQELAQRLEGAEIRIARKADEGGGLFGSVTKAAIAEELTKLGFGEVKKDQPKLEEPIKEVGEYTVELALDHGLEATIRVIVEAEE